MSERKPWREPILKRIRKQWATPVLDQISQFDEKRGSGCVFMGIGMALLLFWVVVIYVVGHFIGWW